MKLLSIVLVFLSMSLAANATSVTYTKKENPTEFKAYVSAVVEEITASKIYHIPDHAPEEIKKNASKFLDNGEYSCWFKSKNKEWARWLLNYAVETSKAVHITDGIQPLLQFDSGNYFTTGYTVTITTSADYKKILKVTADEFITKDVNIGDLKNPKYVKQRVQVLEKQCTATNKL